MITLYDLANKASMTSSPNPWKARYVLNMKKLPYRTVYLEFPDIERVSKEAGIGPSAIKPDGTPYYTCPAIVDDATGVAVSDSYKIAEYLDKQYPDTPKAFPARTEALQAAFYRYFNDHILPLVFLLVPAVTKTLNEPSVEYFERTRAAFFRKPSLDQVRPVGEELTKTWEKVTTLFDSLESWYAKSSGKFLVGDTPSFGDFTVGGMIYAMKLVCGDDDGDWKKLKALNNGRWEKLLKDLEPYADVSN